MVAASMPTLASCSDPNPPAVGSSADAPFVGHVHGLGVDPVDQVLYVAAHGGLFRLLDGRLQLVADRAQDTMGFTVVGPRHFLASGHPAPTDTDRPVHLGLIESRDAGNTWTEKSMSGRADFHSIEAGPGAVYAYDSQTQTVMKTSDQQTWTTLLVGDVYDLAAHPTRRDQLLVTTRTGVVRIRGTDQTTLPAPAELALLDWPGDNLLAGVTASGTVHRSTNGGQAWTVAGQLPGHVEAFTAEPTGWYAATEQGLFTSADQGSQWTRLL
jgi:hypothetical protein